MAKFQIRHALLAVLGLLAVSASSVFAAEPAATDRSPAFRQCVRGSGGVTAAMRACMADEYRRLDKALNAAYRGALRRLPNDAARSRLRDVQRAWLNTREPLCRAEIEKSGMAGGTGGLLIEDSCRLRVVSERTQWLHAYPQPTPNGR